MSTKTIRIGSRGSDLALWQARHVKQQLESLGAEVSITIIKTQGDRIQDIGFDKMEGKGFFTKEIEAALLAGEIDLAVHSHKDLETESPAGLLIAAVSEREDPRDVLLIHSSAVDGSQDYQLKSGARIGTSSARRKSLVARFFPEGVIVDLRGNVPTRVEKVRSGEYDAILLAKAGLDRLGLDLSDLTVVPLDPEEFVPAPAQGVLALQTRSDDHSTIEAVEKLNHKDVQSRIAVERRVLNLMQGGCQLPLGVHCPEEGRVFVSFSNDWSEGADLYEFEGEHGEELAEIIVETLNEPEEE